MDSAHHCSQTRAVHSFGPPAWTTLSVIAGRTTTIKLGTIHLAQPFRAQGMTAKMAAHWTRSRVGG